MHVIPYLTVLVLNHSPKFYTGIAILLNVLQEVSSGMAENLVNS